MKLNRAEKAAILITAIFVALLIGYQAAVNRIGGDFVVITDKGDGGSDVLIGGDKETDNADEKEVPSAAEPAPEETEEALVIEWPLNINTATAEELTYLPGIGEVIAGRIIAHRKENGDFKDISDIMDVRGIGQKIFEGIRGLITT